MAHQEACQLYIEQEIEEGLKHGKTPYSIGKELSAWVEKLFEVKISSNTLKDRAYRMKKKNDGNQPKPPISKDNRKSKSKIPKGRPSGPVKYPKSITTQEEKPETKPKPPQYAAVISDAMYFARVG